MLYIKHKNEQVELKEHTDHSSELMRLAMRRVSSDKLIINLEDLTKYLEKKYPDLVDQTVASDNWYDLFHKYDIYGTKEIANTSCDFFRDVKDMKFITEDVEYDPEDDNMYLHGITIASEDAFYRASWYAEHEGWTSYEDINEDTDLEFYKVYPTYSIETHWNIVYETLPRAPQLFPI